MTVLFGITNIQGLYVAPHETPLTLQLLNSQPELGFAVTMMNWPTVSVQPPGQLGVTFPDPELTLVIMV